MIYCVIPRELEDELFDKMVEYYKDNPNVTVIIDRREGPRSPRRAGKPGGSARSATGAARGSRARSSRQRALRPTIREFGETC